MNMTINDFILRKKIDIAKSLLLESSKTLAYISEYLGFSSPPHFSSTFKKYIGISPKEYSQNILKNNKTK